eukprot:6777005-Alexandrium_andersonii.AAC.1
MNSCLELPTLTPPGTGGGNTRSRQRKHLPHRHLPILKAWSRSTPRYPRKPERMITCREMIAFLMS